VSKFDDAERVSVDTAAEWGAWLAEHHDTSTGAWLVLFRKHVDGPANTYEDAVVEALAWGWIDSVVRPVDTDRRLQWFAPRKKGSGWARTNKARIEQLEREGRMQPSGAAVIAAAKADGSWTLLDDVEALIVPADLAEAFLRHPGAAERWEAFPKSVKRLNLEWIVTAKRAATRAARVEQVAENSARGERDNAWRKA
jgi:uncharacterized protein YdeI (YjbR/CyaY-like superfamily)